MIETPPTDYLTDHIDLLAMLSPARRKRAILASESHAQRLAAAMRAVAQRAEERRRRDRRMAIAAFMIFVATVAACCLHAVGVL